MIFGDWVQLYVLFGFIGGMMSLLVIGEELTTTRKKRFFAFNVGDIIDAVYHRQHRDVHSFIEGVSFRTLVVSLTVFGLVGLGLTFLFSPTVQVKSWALLAGGVTFGLDIWLAHRREVRQAQKHQWTILDAVGRVAPITITIPGGGIGAGAIALRFIPDEDEDPVTFQAITQGQGLSRGGYALVMRAVSDDTVEVQAAPAPAANTPGGAAPPPPIPNA
jgi:hypothetical protein